MEYLVSCILALVRSATFVGVKLEINFEDYYLQLNITDGRPWSFDLVIVQQVLFTLWNIKFLITNLKQCCVIYA